MSKRSNKKRKKRRSKINKGYTSSASPPKMKHRGGMAKKGTCNVCGRFRKLEFDHIPPNATRKIIQSQSHYLKNKSTDMINLGKKYENTQVLGFKTVCRDCNKISGLYVPGFNNMIKQLLTHINQGIDGRWICININLIDVFKQLLYMFMVQNYEFKHQKYHRFFYDIFSNRNSYRFSIPNAGSYHIKILARIYMGFYTKYDLIYHADQVASINLPDVSMTGNGTVSLQLHFQEYMDAIKIGACENIIAFSPFFFRLCVGLDPTQDTDTDKLINLSNFITMFDEDQSFLLKIDEYDIDLPPKSFRSSLLGHGEWEKTDN